MAEIKPAYLIAGDDEAKIATACARLRGRAEREGGPGALERVAAPEGRRAPDVDELVSSLAAISLTASRRYVLVEGAERWGKGDAGRVADALGAIPPETTVVLVARGKAPAALAKAVEGAGGDVLSYRAPKARDLPRRLVADAAERGFELAPDAARLLVERIGGRTVRLGCELDRLALWAGEGGRVEAADLEAMLADTSEAAIWSLADALIEGDAEAAIALAERLTAQGEALPRIVYSVAPRLSQALRASLELEAGRTPKDVAAGLEMHPYAAKMVVSRVRGREPAELEAAICALADLEVASRGGADHPEPVALTLALRRAAAVA